MKKRFLVMVPMVMVLLHAVISYGDESSDCMARCDKETADCVAKVSALMPYTAEEQQKLDECERIRADCHSQCAEGVPTQPPEPVKSQPAETDSGVPEDSGK